jgi:hypothetical protein
MLCPQVCGMRVAWPSTLDAAPMQLLPGTSTRYAYYAATCSSSAVYVRLCMHAGSYRVAEVMLCPHACGMTQRLGRSIHAAAGAQLNWGPHRVACVCFCMMKQSYGRNAAACCDSTNGATMHQLAAGTACCL